MKALIPVVTALFALLLSACAPRVIYKDVYIPTKCRVLKPTRPPKSLNTLDYLKALLIYTEQLERDLDFCIEGNLSK